MYKIMPQLLYNSVRLLLTKPNPKNVKKTGGILIVQNKEGQ